MQGRGKKRFRRRAEREETAEVDDDEPISGGKISEESQYKGFVGENCTVKVAALGRKDRLLTAKPQKVGMHANNVCLAAAFSVI
jgi:hypothetical protein